jgi:hypothetical protein
MVKIHIFIIWAMTPCRFLDGVQQFGETISVSTIVVKMNALCFPGMQVLGVNPEKPY